MQPLLIWDVEVLLRQLLLQSARLQLLLRTIHGELHRLRTETGFQLRASASSRSVSLSLCNGLRIVLIVQSGQRRGHIHVLLTAKSCLRDRRPRPAKSALLRFGALQRGHLLGVLLAHLSHCGVDDLLLIRVHRGVNLARRNRRTRLLRELSRLLQVRLIRPLSLIDRIHCGLLVRRELRYLLPLVCRGVRVLRDIVLKLTQDVAIQRPRLRVRCACRGAG